MYHYTINTGKNVINIENICLGKLELEEKAIIY